MTAAVRWFRVFGSVGAAPDSGGEEWFRAEVPVPGAGPIVLERWLADEEGVRAELNRWAALLEACPDGPHRVPLMERAVQARQLITLRAPAGAEGDAEALCRRLASATGGFYQADGAGFFAADGEPLVGESDG